MQCDNKMSKQWHCVAGESDDPRFDFTGGEGAGNDHPERRMTRESSTHALKMVHSLHSAACECHDIIGHVEPMCAELGGWNTLIGTVTSR